MVTGAVDTAGARLLVDKVRRDATLSASARRRAQRLLSVIDRPAVVLERLQREAADVLPLLARHPATEDMARAVPAMTFWRYHCRAEVHDAFVTADDFIQAVESESDRDAFLLSCLSSNEPLMPWSRSWLAEYRAIRGLDGPRLSAALELEKSPPFVVFVFDAEACRREGLTIRTPCSLDSVLGPNLQWTPGGLRSGLAEYVDGDLPRSGVTSLEWVP